MVQQKRIKRFSTGVYYVPIKYKDGESTLIRKLRLYGEQFIQIIKKFAPEKKQKTLFYLTQSEAERFSYSNHPISVSEITKRINRLIDDDSRKKLKATDITERLLSEGLLKIVEANGKKYKLPTFDGTKMGLTMERRESESGERYFVTLYNREAQAYLLEHLSFFELK